MYWMTQGKRFGEKLWKRGECCMLLLGSPDGLNAIQNKLVQVHRVKIDLLAVRHERDPAKML